MAVKAHFPSMQIATLQAVQAAMVHAGDTDDLHSIRTPMCRRASHVCYVTGDSGQPDEAGRHRIRRLIVTGNWREDEQGHFLTVHIMEALCTPALDEILPAHVDPLSDLKLAGAATCLTAYRPASSLEVTQMYMGMAQGGVSRLTLSHPRGIDSLGIPHDDIEISQSGMQPWQTNHSGKVAAIAVSLDGQVLTAGSDGKLCLSPYTLTHQQAGAAAYADAGPWESYSAACWLTGDTFVTAGTSVGLQLWDSRQPGGKCGRSPLHWGSCKAGVSRIHSLAPIPHQGPLVASGAAEGAVLLWDVRFVQQPVVCTEAHPGAGDVWQVQYDAGCYSDMGDREQALLACTSSGELTNIPLSKAMMPGCDTEQIKSSKRQVYRTQCRESINAFATGTDGAENEIIAVSDSEELIHLRRPRPV